MRRYLWIGIIGTLLTSLALITVCKEVPPPFIEMEVKGVSLDPTTQNPVVILSDKEGKKALPIWIGLPEATAIERELKNIPSQRPMTHDLLHSILGRVQVKVKEMKVVELKEHTYYARLLLTLNGETIEIDARPSDAIIIALKSKAPVFVATKIVDEQAIALTKKEGPGEGHGIRVQELTPSLASHFNFKGPKGVLVSEVLAGSPSEASGIKAGDIITRVNTKEIGNPEEFEEAFDAVKEVQSVRVSLFRDGKSEEVGLRLRP